MIRSCDIQKKDNLSMEDGVKIFRSSVKTQKTQIAIDDEEANQKWFKSVQVSFRLEEL